MKLSIIEKKYSKNSGPLTGFTIIELVISIFIITVAVVGIYSAFSLAVILSSDAANRLTAAYLVQEGQEIVRNIRDTNWLKIDAGTETDWLANELDNACSSGCEIDYNSTVAIPWQQADHLNINDNGFYTLSTSGTSPTKFNRKITVSQIESYAVLVKVEVSWDEKSNLLYLKQEAGVCNTKYNCVEAEATLYNWYPSATQP